jgi:hypothetical protein
MISMFDSIPSLRLRKDIWTHFPVCLIKLPTTDGRDRYAVQWHQKNLDTWCQKIPQYEELVRFRLLKALAMSDRWSLEVPKTHGDLCVIAMNFSEEPRNFHTLPDMYAETVDIQKVDDIKNYFPICWKSRKNAHTLEFHNTFVKALAQKHGVDELDIRRTTLERLMPILKESWTVVAPNKTSSAICTIHH